MLMFWKSVQLLELVKQPFGPRVVLHYYNFKHIRHTHQSQQTTVGPEGWFRTKAISQNWAQYVGSSINPRPRGLYFPVDFQKDQPFNGKSNNKHWAREKSSTVDKKRIKEFLARRHRNVQVLGSGCISYFNCNQSSDGLQRFSAFSFCNWVSMITQVDTSTRHVANVEHEIHRRWAKVLA